jgi:hypothetical protein
MDLLQIVSMVCNLLGQAVQLVNWVVGRMQSRHETEGAVRIVSFPDRRSGVDRRQRVVRVSSERRSGFDRRQAQLAA